MSRADRKSAGRLQDFLAAHQEAPLPDDVRALRKLVVKYREAERRNRAVHSVVLDALREAMEPLTPPTVEVPSLGKKQPGREIQHVHISDIQGGKRTATYDFAVSAKRLRRLFDGALHLRDLTQQKVTDLVIHLNGDIVEGELIFPAQQMEIEASVLRQALRVSQMLAAEVLRVATQYRAVRIYVTPGNHGRSTRDFSAESNWDLVAAHLLSHLCQHAPNVKFTIADSWYLVVRENGWGFLQTHGDMIHSWMNLPWYGMIQRGMRWSDTIEGAWDYLLLGHFHNYANFSWNRFEVMVNGTVESGNEYARKQLGMAGVPVQTVFFSHPKYGVTSRYPVWLEERTPRRQ